MYTEKPHNSSGQLQSPNLRLRNSATIWGPLQMELINHCEGTEKGYEAGQAAYQEAVSRQGRPIGFVGAETFDLCMRIYFDTPRFRPRATTPKIAEEWRAMFLLGWTSQMLVAMPRVASTTDEPIQPQWEREHAPTHHKERVR